MWGKAGTKWGKDSANRKSDRNFGQASMGRGKEKTFDLDSSYKVTSDVITLIEPVSTCLKIFRFYDNIIF